MGVPGLLGPGGVGVLLSLVDELWRRHRLADVDHRAESPFVRRGVGLSGCARSFEVRGWPRLAEPGVLSSGSHVWRPDIREKPPEGVDPPACGLRNRRSTAELRWRGPRNPRDGNNLTARRKLIDAGSFARACSGSPDGCTRTAGSVGARRRSRTG